MAEERATGENNDYLSNRGSAKVKTVSRVQGHACF